MFVKQQCIKCHMISDGLCDTDACIYMYIININSTYVKLILDVITRLTALILLCVAVMFAIVYNRTVNWLKCNLNEL